MIREYEIQRLFRAFNRRATDDAMHNYAELLSEFDTKLVSKAIDYVIDTEDTLPNPAALKRAVQSQARFKQEESGCDACDGKGYIDVVKDDEYDPYGFKHIGKGKCTLCPVCRMEPQDRAHLHIVDKEKARIWVFARLLARKCASRVAGYLDMYDPAWADECYEWRDRWWSKEHINKWVAVAEKIKGANGLVFLTSSIDAVPVEELVADPFTALDVFVTKQHEEVPEMFRFIR